MDPRTRARLPGARTATGLALAATLLTGAGVAAQTPSSSPAPSTTTPPTQTQTQPNGGMGFGRGGQGGFQRGQGGPGQGGPGQQGFGGFGPGGPGGRGFDGSGLDARMGDAITVASNDGTSLGLQTADGWSRTIDTTGVVLTRNGATITASDIQVGERVRVAETRNADGSYTVTGIEVQPSVVTGTVGTPSTTGFTVVASDGTTTTVTVNDQTTWQAAGSTSASLADATAGRSVAVAGQLQADGSILATAIRLG
jgi:hypothetical protein